MNEEVDKQNTEMDGPEEEASQPRKEVLSEYQKKMREERAKRFGVDGRIL